ncbi:MAG TPA: hypothetical protein VGO14_00440 [Solirubrobacteraceae bacterium]|nr:hypothetical protein [Solirubrobacteraceae bacterium]
MDEGTGAADRIDGRSPAPAAERRPMDPLSSPDDSIWDRRPMCLRRARVKMSARFRRRRQESAAGRSLSLHANIARTETVPRILITTEQADEPDALVMLDERIAASDLTSEHFAGHLIQRIAWALADAETTEHEPVDRRERLWVVQQERSRPLPSLAY